MNNCSIEDEVKPGIEFIKVEPNEFKDDFRNEIEIEDPKDIKQIIKYLPKARDYSHPNPVKKKVIRVRYYNKNKTGYTERVFRTPAVPSCKEDTVKQLKKLHIPVSREQAIKLIKKVRKEHCIWDTTNEHYRDKGIKDTAWNRVAAHVELPVETVRAKWISLLGSYRSYTSRMKKGLRDGKPRWYAYKLLNFLTNEMDGSSQKNNLELSTYVGSDEECEESETSQTIAEETMPSIGQETVEYLEEALLPEITAPTIVNRVAQDNGLNEGSETSCSEEILRIVRSMSKVLNKMANIGMPVDYGRYVNAHLKEYDDEIRRKTVKSILDLITAADEEMSRKYPDRSQIPGTSVAKPHKK